MKGPVSILCALATAILLIVVTGGLTSVQAQPGTCYKCTLYQQQYYCIPASDGLGHHSCTVSGGQGCTLGAICGFYRRLGDGTFEVPTSSKPRRASKGRRLSEATRNLGPPAEFVLAGFGSRAVDRGCNGTIVRREYSETATRRLTRATRVINV